MKPYHTVPLAVFLLAQTAWVVPPSLYGLSLLKDQRWLFATGVLALSLVTLGPFFIFRRYFKRVSPAMCVLSVFSWSCIIDLGMALELDGYISNYIAFYFAEGEPYLMTAHGTVIDYWDGTVHLALYLAIIYFYTKRESYREVGLYWLGSMLNSMIVLLQGGVAGNHTFKMSILLNTPYAILPVLIGFKFLHSRPPQARTSLKYPPIWQRPFDCLFLMYFIGAICVAIFRGMTVLGGNAEAMKDYLNIYEPYLNDPEKFPKFQVLTYGYFFLVYYLSAAYGLVYPGQHWMTDWSLVHAGAAAHAQFTYIAGSFHHRTPKSLHSPRAGVPALVFWIINLALLIVPHLFAWWCKQDEDKFGRTYAVERVELLKEDTSRNIKKLGKGGKAF